VVKLGELEIPVVVLDTLPPDTWFMVFYDHYVKELAKAFGIPESILIGDKGEDKQDDS
jgi:hypothetical protein